MSVGSAWRSSELLHRPAQDEGRLRPPSSRHSRSGRDWVVDSAGFAGTAALGALTLRRELRESPDALSTAHLVLDVAAAALSCASLWWRRRWPLGVALVCVALGTVSTAATFPGLLALFSLAVYRSVKPVLVVAALFVGSALLFAVYSPTTDVLSAVLDITALVLPCIGWGMYVRARRQLVATLRERALRAEADQQLHADQARTAERTRIAREMHDVLGHRISMLALHAGALEVRPDLPPEKVRETAELLRSTARQALEELRHVIGVLRDGSADTGPAVPQPTLADISRLVDETRRAGAKLDFAMHVEQPETASAGLGRDTYRIVQEALTNMTRHARGTAGRVRVSGSPGRGLSIDVRNRLPARAPTSAPAGSGAGLLGLQERVSLAGGTLVHGPDDSGDFVVHAELRW
jgi:signal transduction histidine kinase